MAKGNYLVHNLASDSSQCLINTLDDLVQGMCAFLHILSLPFPNHAYEEQQTAVSRSAGNEGDRPWQGERQQRKENAGSHHDENQGR